MFIVVEKKEGRADRFVAEIGIIVDERKRAVVLPYHIADIVAEHFQKKRDVKGNKEELSYEVEEI
jgi:hypothetical protein